MKLIVFRVLPYENADPRWFAAKDIGDLMNVATDWYRNWSNQPMAVFCPFRIEKIADLENEYCGTPVGEKR